MLVAIGPTEGTCAGVLDERRASVSAVHRVALTHLNYGRGLRVGQEPIREAMMRERAKAQIMG